MTNDEKRRVTRECDRDLLERKGNSFIGVNDWLSDTNTAYCPTDNMSKYTSTVAPRVQSCTEGSICVMAGNPVDVSASLRVFINRQDAQACSKGVEDWL